MKPEPLDPEWVEGEIRAIVREILEVAPPCRIIVFGSTAPKTAVCGSDIDIAVVAKPEDDLKSFRKRFLQRVTAKGLRLDWVFVDSARFFDPAFRFGVLENIHSAGRTIYESH